MVQRSNHAEARFGDLEARMAEQEKAILELSDELYRQQQQIAQLEAQLRHVVERIKATAADAPNPSPEDEIPPHF
jgi:uncharacterized coiled-coil protein SlyX